MALAVGLTPELLPAIVSVTLSAGARRMAKRGVIVRRLAAIENLGSVDILCTDKTGTLTKGVVELSGAVDADGEAVGPRLSLRCDQLASGDRDRQSARCRDYGGGGPARARARACSERSTRSPTISCASG